MTEAFVYGGVRTPFGKFGGACSRAARVGPGMLAAAGA
jgi:hypothetical protein